MLRISRIKNQSDMLSVDRIAAGYNACITNTDGAGPAAS